MSRVMMWCGNLGKEVFSGLILDHGTSLKGHAAHKFQCGACGFVHSLRNPWFEEDGPTPLDKHFFPLDVIPYVAAEVGIMVSIFWSIEFSMPQILHRLAKLNSGDAHMIMGYFKSFSDKTELLKLIISNRPTPDDYCNKVSALLPRLAVANSLRNKYVHAQFGIGAERKLHLRPFHADARRKTKPEIKTLDDVFEDTRVLRAIAIEAHSVAFA